MNFTARFSFLSVILLTLVGCAGALVPDSNDPVTLISRGSYEMIQERRGLPAGNLFYKALTICQQRGDKECEAESYLQIASLKKFKNHLITPYDDNIKNIDTDYAFKQSIALYKNQGAYMNAAAAAFEYGNYYIKNDPTTGCSKYDESLGYYNMGLAKGQKYNRVNSNPNYSDLNSMVAAFKQQYCRN